jgi:crotonobetainyl-CoA:carnitine CoA-transferase CaiB-like acyl-CoA transferase
MILSSRASDQGHDCGFCDAATRDKDWAAYGEQLATGDEPIAEFERVKRAIASCTAAHTKAEMLAVALDRGLLVAPVSTVRDVVQSGQLASRDFLQTLEHDDGRRVIYPGPFARFGLAPIRYRRRPPRIDEHGDEIRAEAAPARAAPAPSAQSNDRPLAGVKILDFMWALAGPGATRTLADCGATVIRVESTTRLDVCRTLFPFRAGEFGPENSALFHNTNAGKKLICLDPNKPEGRETLIDLVRWADVVTESFSPKGMRGFGLGYDTLQQIKPDLIMLSTCLMGQTGLLARFAGFGNLAAAFAGFYELTGWPDRDPAGPFGAYTDYIAPRFNAAAVLAALEHRQRTGEGQHIDLSQVEASLHFLTPTILDWTVNGRVPGRTGNRDPDMHPHGVYRCEGDDRWVAIAVRDDADWRALCDQIEPARASDPRFASVGGRLEHADELDAWLTRFTERLPMHEVEACLQAVGVPAQAVLNSPEFVADPQLRARGHFVELPHPEGGHTTIEATRFQLSRTPPAALGAAPTFGADAMWVLEEVLGYDGERIAELAIAGALE